MFVVKPPIVESLVGAYEESLFGWQGLGKHIRDICAMDDEVFCGGYSIKDAGTHLIDTIHICEIQDVDLS